MGPVGVVVVDVVGDEVFEMALGTHTQQASEQEDSKQLGILRQQRSHLPFEVS